MNSEVRDHYAEKLLELRNAARQIFHEASQTGDDAAQSHAAGQARMTEMVVDCLGLEDPEAFSGDLEARNYWSGALQTLGAVLGILSPVLSNAA